MSSGGQSSGPLPWEVDLNERDYRSGRAQKRNNGIRQERKGGESIRRL
jgi:hypothetical protein